MNNKNNKIAKVQIKFILFDKFGHAYYISKKVSNEDMKTVLEEYQHA